MDFDFNFKNESDYQNFIKYLKSIAKYESVEHKEMHKRILNTNREIFCIAMAEIRKIAKKIAKTDPYGYIKYVKNASYEEVLILGLVIVELDDLDEQIKYLESYKEIIDSWSLVDSVCSSMKKLKKSKDKEKYFEHFLNMCYEEKEFASRLGIITLMVNFLEEKYIDQIYEMCEKVSNDGYYVKMGIAWLISFGFIDFKDKTLKLLERRTLDKFTQNKAIAKCRESFRVSAEDKEKLKQFIVK